MSQRASILWLCLGALLFAAGNTPFVLESPSSHLASETTSQSSVDSTSFELLSTVYGPDDAAVAEVLQVPPNLDEPTLWLARAAFSETKLPHEQELVAWVVRNRVETGYRNKTTYREVVLDPYQFSAFNPNSSKRSYLLRLSPEEEQREWRRALWIAHYVRHADPADRPFSRNTRHFFSERSMEGHIFPYWADHQHFVSPNKDYFLNERRFRFYKEIS